MRGNVGSLKRDLIVKLAMYITFGKNVGFKKYLHGVSDAGTRLLFKFRLGMHGINEELRRHRGREGKMECTLCCKGVHSNKFCFLQTTLKHEILVMYNASRKVMFPGSWIHRNGQNSYARKHKVKRLVSYIYSTESSNFLIIKHQKFILETTCVFHMET